MSVEVHEEAFTDPTMQDDPVDFGSLAGVKHNSVALDTTTQDDPPDYESLFTQGKRETPPGITKRIYFFHPTFRRLFVVVAGDAVVNEVTEEGLSFPGDVVWLAHTPEHWQRPEAEPVFWWGAFTPTCNPKVSFSEQTEEQSSEFIPRTSLAKRLWELRQKIIASGRPLLDWDDLENELHERRGERSSGEES
jgi:hypothetical protein